MSTDNHAETAQSAVSENTASGQCAQCTAADSTDKTDIDESAAKTADKSGELASESHALQKLSADPLKSKCHSASESSKHLHDTANEHHAEYAGTAPDFDREVEKLARHFRHIGYTIFGGLALMIVIFLVYTAAVAISNQTVFDPVTGENVYR